MNQSERLIYLISALQEDMPEYGKEKIPSSMEQKQIMFRALMNICPPLPVTDEFLRIQDEYLQQEQLQKKITDIDTLKPVSSDARLYLWQGDITALKVGAIVNAANSQMLGCFIPCHRCIDNAIHSFAGVQLRLACRELMDEQGCPEPTGSAKITPAYNLPCDYVLHTVGPIVQNKVTDKHRNLLKSCYRSCLELADQNGLKSVAFCCISTGEFRFPQKEAAEIAVNTVREFLDTRTNIKNVVFNVFKDEDRMIYETLLS